MLQAVEASNNQSLVNAPKVTVFDGGTAVIGVETLFSYVSNLQPTVGSGGSVGFTATINQVPSGVTLLVKATVSSDRKYVTLQLQPLFTSLLSLVTFQLTEPTSAISGGGGTGSGTTIVTGGTSSVGEFVQLPTLQVTTVETLVSVPDGGTLLMGGQTLAGETQKEDGTPVLSKIPFLKRLFTNQSMAKDEQVILLLVKPTILIQREQEDKAFPLLSNQASGE
jgi:type II secretory pathway component GspD/PulD (secretin)